MPTRRQFLATTTARAGFIPFANADETEGETDHFLYRLAPKFPTIESQRGNLAFGFGDGQILFSEDNGKTWPHRKELTDANNVTFSCILGNGNVIFATQAKLILSTDKLASIREITVRNPDGSDYLPHTPKDPAKPGWYFHALDGVHTWNVHGKEILVWGNYCNVLGGSVPVNVYYSRLIFAKAGSRVTAFCSSSRNHDMTRLRCQRPAKHTTGHVPTRLEIK